MGAHNICFYRDGSLTILKDAPGPSAERTKKKIIKIFQEYGLKNTAHTNLVATNFLGVTVNLKSEKYWPFRKLNYSQLYVHSQSNHPPIIKKQLLIMLAKRLSIFHAAMKNLGRPPQSMKKPRTGAGTRTNKNMKCVPTQTKEELGNEKSYVSIFHIVNMFAPTSVGNSIDF